MASGTANQTFVLSKTATTGTVTTGSSATAFIDTALSTVNTYLGRFVRFTTGVNVGKSRYITAYTVATSIITVATTEPWIATPTIGDAYEIAPVIPSGATFMYLLSWERCAIAATSSPILYLTATTGISGQKIVTGLGSVAAGGIPTNRHDYITPLRIPANDGDITIAVNPSAAYAAVNDITLQVAFL